MQATDGGIINHSGIIEATPDETMTGATAGDGVAIWRKAEIDGLSVQGHLCPPRHSRVRFSSNINSSATYSISQRVECEGEGGGFKVVHPYRTQCIGTSALRKCCRIG